MAQIRTYVSSVYKSLRHTISWKPTILRPLSQTIRIHGRPRHYVVKLRFAAIIACWSSRRYLDGDSVCPSIMLRVAREVSSTTLQGKEYVQHQTPGRVCPSGDQPCRIQTDFCFCCVVFCVLFCVLFFCCVLFSFQQLRSRYVGAQYSPASA